MSSSQRLPGSLLVESQPVTDGIIHERLQNADPASVAVYEALLPSKDVLEQEKQAFYDSHMTVNPDLRPRGVDLEALDRREQGLRDFKRELKADDSGVDPVVRQMYQWRVNEDIANLGMLRAAATGDSKRFNAYNNFIYGKPSQEVFAATADWFGSIADRNLDSDVPEVREAAETTVKLLADARGDQSLLTPPAGVFEAIRDQHFKEDGYYALLLSGITLPESGKVDPSIGEPAIQQMLQNLDGEYERTENPSGDYWGIAHDRKQFMGPFEYNLPVKRFIGLPLGHEGGSHILERMNGMRLPLRLLATGLDRYEQGNEGRAVIREQVPYESFESFASLLRWQDILRRHFAISLASGLLTGEKLNFADTYQAMNTVDRLIERSKKPEDIEAADAKAHKRTWSLLQRVLKGTDGHGGAYLKDKIYLEGNIACWQEAAKNPDMITAGDLGKFDITNPRHIAILQEKGILPAL